MLKEDRRQHVVTPNNEMLVMSVRNRQFRKVLQRADLRLPDSTGLLLAARMTGQRLPCRVTGVDTVESVCGKLGADQGVFFLGGRNGVASQASAALVSKNPRLRIAGMYEGSPLEEDSDTIVTKINESGARLLLVAFGAPAQDLWIAENFSRLTSVKVAIGVGGTFDFLSGRIRRAPQTFRMLGLEWLWRLILEPRRIGRIWRAVVVFSVLVLMYGRDGK